jgi:ankyrin repeat protein
MRPSPPDATPLWLAAKYVNVPVMKALIAGGADPSLTLGDGTTPMMAAAGLTQFEGPHSRRGDVSTFRTNWDEDDGLEAVRMLVDLGADVNAKNQVGQTALHAAAYLGANRIVRFLVDHHANFNAQDQQGQTPFRVAQAHLNVSAQGVTHNAETARLLQELGADTRLGVDGENLLRQLQRAAARLDR